MQAASPTVAGSRRRRHGEHAKLIRRGEFPPPRAERNPRGKHSARAHTRARSPFVQLFASPTGRPIYCPARYTGRAAPRRTAPRRADICSPENLRDRPRKDRRSCNCNRDRTPATRAASYLPSRRMHKSTDRAAARAPLSGDHRSAARRFSLCPRKINKYPVVRKFCDEPARSPTRVGRREIPSVSSLIVVVEVQANPFRNA